MRYYVYLDRELIKNICSSLDNIDFDIDIIEYSVQDTKNVSDDFYINPNYSNICNYYNKDEKKDNKNDIGIKFNKGSKVFYSTTVEKKFININTISEIKSISFYDKLLKQLEKSNKENNEKNLYMDKGTIYPYKLVNKFNCDIDLNNNDFFLLNDNIIWINENYLESEFLILCNLVCSVNVIGFVINNSCNKKVIKAMAIYID